MIYRVFNLKKTVTIVNKFGSAFLFSMATFTFQVLILSCGLYFIVKLFPTFAECAFLSVLVSCVDGSSIDDSISQEVRKEKFAQSKQDMLKLINIGNNYVVFLIAQIIVPFMQEDYFTSYSREQLSSIAFDFSL